MNKGPSCTSFTPVAQKMRDNSGTSPSNLFLQLKTEWQQRPETPALIRRIHTSSSHHTPHQCTDSAEEWVRSEANHSFGVKQGHGHSWFEALFAIPHVSDGPRLHPPSIKGFNRCFHQGSQSTMPWLAISRRCGSIGVRNPPIRAIRGSTGNGRREVSRGVDTAIGGGTQMGELRFREALLAQSCALHEVER